MSTAKAERGITPPTQSLVEPSVNGNSSDVRASHFKKTVLAQGSSADVFREPSIMDRLLNRKREADVLSLSPAGEGGRVTSTRGYNGATLEKRFDFDQNGKLERVEVKKTIKDSLGVSLTAGKEQVVFKGERVIKKVDQDGRVVTQVKRDFKRGSTERSSYLNSLWKKKWKRVEQATKSPRVLHVEISAKGGNSVFTKVKGFVGKTFSRS